MSKLRKDCFEYWKIERGGTFLLPCHGSLCNGALFQPSTTTWEAEHERSRFLGGSDEPPNCRPFCIPCHKIKTGEDDAPRHAKVRATTKKHFGVNRPNGFRKPPAGFRRDWKHGGRLVKVDTE